MSNEKEIESVLKESLILDELKEEKEFREFDFELPPAPEPVAEIIEEEEIDEDDLIDFESEDDKTQEEKMEEADMTADAIMGLIHGASFFGMNHLAKRYSGKISAEEYYQLQLLKEKLDDELTEGERELVIKSVFNEKKLGELQARVEISPGESEKLEKAAKYWARMNNINIGPNTGFVTKILAILGPKIHTVITG